MDLDKIYIFGQFLLFTKKKKKMQKNLQKKIFSEKCLFVEF